MTFFGRYHTSKRKTTSGIILAVEESDHIVLHKGTSKLLTIEYNVDGIQYVQQVLARYVDPLDLPQLEVHQRIEVCYKVEHPEEISLPYFSSLKQLFK